MIHKAFRKEDYNAVFRKRTGLLCADHSGRNLRSAANSPWNVAMEWDEEEHEWFNVTHCDTPEALREAILSAYEGYMQLSLVTDCHAPTEEEIRTIQKRSADLRLLCNVHGKMTII